MKIVKTIYLSYATTTTYVSTASVHVAFPVKFIHVKSVAYYASLPATQYITIQSDLTEWQPLCMTYRNNHFDNCMVDTLIEFEFPRRIGGSYNFTMTFASGTPASGTSGGDYIVILAEFYDKDSYPPQIKTHPLQFTDLPGENLNIL